jgi:predicted RNase H-like nuclease (RuvC/YqgF family)
MGQKNSKIFDKKMMQTVSAFCSANNIEDIDDFMYRCFKQGFDIERYGLLGNSVNVSEKEVIKEVIVEKRIEIPVEVIIEVEKVVEVPVEVIKEVEKVVVKTEYITDKESENELGGIITKLEEEMSKKDEELDELRRNLDIKLDDTQTKMLQETLQKLRKEITEKNEKIKQLEKINQDLQNTKLPLKGFFMRGSNLNDTI